MASDQQHADRLRGELVSQGAQAVTVSGSAGLGGGPTTLSVEFDGDPEMVRYAVGEVDGLRLKGQPQAHEWPGGDTHVEAEITVPEVGSGAFTPGGGADDSPSSVPPPEDEGDPHCAPGDGWPVEDENGITDEYEVEAWMVRSWQPVGSVDAMTVLRYVPAPEAHGLDWWAGYVRVAPADTDAALVETMRARVRDRCPEYEGVPVPTSYHDSHHWLGWSEADLLAEVAGVPVVSSVPEDSFGQVDHQEAASITEGFARAAQRVRGEVLR